MGVGKWIKNKLAGIALATTSIEKAALGQDGGTDLGTGSAQHQRHRQGSLADALIQGEVTQEVEELRWRMYKVLEKSNNYKTKVVGYTDEDENGDTFMITETVEVDPAEEGRLAISKIKVDEFDTYPLEFVVNNDEITLGTLGDVNDEITLLDQKEINNSKTKDEEGNWSVSLGVVKGDSNVKVPRVISCVRELRAKFEIEDYSEKMNVRTISDTEKLLEFYVSIYPDEYNRKSRFFISEIKKAIKNPRMTDFLDIVGVEFTSYNTIGVKDLHEFEYKIIKFDKIIEYGGYYVIKFKSEVVKNGESTYEQYRNEDLDKRYDNKEKRDN